MERTAQKGFCMFFDWVDTLDYLSPVDFKAMVKAINDYYTEGKDMVESVTKSTLKALAHNIMQQIKRGEEKTDNCKKAAEKSHESRKKKQENMQDVAEQVQSSAKQMQNLATDTDTDTDTETDTEINLSLPPSAGAAPSDTVGTPLKESFSEKTAKEEFERLWEQYPRKEGKKDALNAYIRAKKKGVAYETVESGIRAYAESCRNRDPQYIKYGSSWFNGEGWNDEYVKEARYDERAATRAYLDELFADHTL